VKTASAISRTVPPWLDNSGQWFACCGHDEPVRSRTVFGRRNQQIVSIERDFRRPVSATVKVP